MGPIAGRRCLVTGGGGFLGFAIVRRLLEKGAAVRTLSRHSHDRLAREGVEQHLGDIADGAAVRNACSGMEIVFHTAARAGIWGPYAAFERTNLQGTLNLLTACAENGVAKLVHTSSPSVVFQGGDMAGVDESVPYPSVYHAAYPETKARAERAVLEAAARGSIHAVVLRPHLIWGPGDNHLVPRILSRSNRLMIVGDGRNIVDTIYIDNAADAHILAGERILKGDRLSGRIYFISQDDPVNLWEMVDAILRAGGKPPVRRRISRRSAYAAGTILEVLYKALGLNSEPRMTRFLAEELATTHWFDISAAKRDLGYVPTVSTAEGLERLAQWLTCRA